MNSPLDYRPGRGMRRIGFFSCRICRALVVIAASFAVHPVDRAEACCPAAPSGVPVVNANQTVIILWDAATHTEHFIRRASFKSAADDFGFLIPTPSQPVLDESGNEAFGFLQKLTEPETQTKPRPTRTGCGCSKEMESGAAIEPAVNILDQKTVAGFDAVVLETDSSTALVDWLKAHGYAFSPEVQAWAEPYLKLHWKITALKVAKNDKGPANTDVSASALRMSFKTDRPLFPYREPDPKGPANTLGAHDRLLRIYFLGATRYQGELTHEVAWTGKAAWANTLSAVDRSKTLQFLKLPENAGPADLWLTEFEDPWPYRAAPADLYFEPSDGGPLKRDPIIKYVSAGGASDAMLYLTPLAVLIPGLVRRRRANPC